MGEPELGERVGIGAGEHELSLHCEGEGPYPAFGTDYYEEIAGSEDFIWSWGKDFFITALDTDDRDLVIFSYSGVGEGITGDRGFRADKYLLNFEIAVLGEAFFDMDLGGKDFLCI